MGMDEQTWTQQESNLLKTIGVSRVEWGLNPFLPPPTLVLKTDFYRSKSEEKEASPFWNIEKCLGKGV